MGFIFLGVPDTQGLFQFGSFLINLCKEVAWNGLLGPRLIVELGPSFLLRIADNVRHRFKVSCLADNPFVDECLGILGKAQEKFSVCLQLVDRVDSFVNFTVQTLYFLLARCAQEEVVHLVLESVVHFDVNVVACSLLALCASLKMNKRNYLIKLFELLEEVHSEH